MSDKQDLLNNANRIQGLSKISFISCIGVTLWGLRNGGILGGMATILCTLGCLISYDTIQITKCVEKNPNTNPNSDTIKDWTKHCFILTHFVPLSKR